MIMIWLSTTDLARSSPALVFASAPQPHWWNTSVTCLPQDLCTCHLLRMMQSSSRFPRGSLPYFPQLLAHMAPFLTLSSAPFFAPLLGFIFLRLLWPPNIWRIWLLLSTALPPQEYKFLKGKEFVILFMPMSLKYIACCLKGAQTYFLEWVNLACEVLSTVPSPD